ncbi:hypothetical protein P872_14710 [Rhodonellum psychrophilum GCM71 = DSM 17998]|uniref:DUF3784 domain-containing protein n=2 Tax=Rhodonellum TaxID=336827 RepID=U5C398_9BACT|nr:MULTISPECIES: DUF3784 domain-containing protein [Rhodonellum]ERM84294.1 hypothetical protein P872_14710 [Rhodonellum psychrophilum GCM71 = DSM 17998]SDZ43459.1 protein of unknown function [Rhodonellum ikkaensis]
MIALYIGLFLIGIGFLVKAFPNLISGYNTMSQKQKEKVDIVRLSTFMRNGFVVMGLLVIFGYLALKLIGKHALLGYFIPGVILTGVIFLVFKAKKFDQNEGNMVKSKLKNLIGIIVITLVAVMIVYGVIPSKFELSDDRVIFSGMYGTEIEKFNVETVSLINKMPPIKARTNGLGLGPIRKGFFRIEDQGKCRLLLHSFQGPFVKISTKDQGTIFVNFKDQAKTELVYAEIMALNEL